jgi:SAM-dependent methyltransferase
LHGIYGYIPRSELARIYRISYNGVMYDYFYSEVILITIDSLVRSFMLTRKGLPDWETLYKTQKVETMPWYNKNFDSDLEKELDERKIINAGGQKFLDLGTGTGTQAMWLAKRGYKVIGSDLSEAAINRARNVYANEKSVDFIVDNILNSKFKGSEFDYIFDRGCFHVLPPEDRKNTSTK